MQARQRRRRRRVQYRRERRLPQLASPQPLAKSAIARVTNALASAPYTADCWSCANILA